MSQQDTDKLKLTNLDGQDPEDPITQAIKQSTQGLSGGNAGLPPTEVGGLESQPQTLPDVAGGAAPDYTKLGKYADQMTGYKMDKFNRPYDQLSEKYKVGLVNSNFDPNQGITPEYLEALRGLNIADFSGSGDKLTAMNGRNGARYGAGGTADTIVGLKSGGKAKWGYWTDPALEGQGGAAGHDASGGHELSVGNPLIPSMNAGLTSSNFFQKLLDQAKQQAGPEATDQRALISLMGPQ